LAAASIPRHTAAKKAAQQKVLDAIKMGATVEQACHQAGRGLKSYEGWRATDEDFRNAVDAIRGKMQPRPEGVPDFPEFRKKYLKSNTYWHQMQWIDVLEGREPRDRHPAQVFEKGRRSRVIINTPPEHAKSTTITMDYVTWRVVKNPNIRVLIVSKNQKMAVKFLYGIKQRLSHPMYADLIRDFAPQGGYKDTADTWSNDMVYLGGAARDDGEQKDPTVQASAWAGRSTVPAPISSSVMTASSSPTLTSTRTRSTG
jgi:hypothetical protein